MKAIATMADQQLLAFRALVAIALDRATGLLCIGKVSPSSLHTRNVCASFSRWFRSAAAIA